MVKTTSLQIFFDGYVLTKNVDDKVHSFCKQCLHKYLVFLNMSALGSLERFGEAGVPCFLKWPFFIETSLDGSGKNRKT